MTTPLIWDANKIMGAQVHRPLRLPPAIAVSAALGTPPVATEQADRSTTLTAGLLGSTDTCSQSSCCYNQRRKKIAFPLCILSNLS